MGLDGYDVAQVCLNGHVANSAYMASPQFRQEYCDQCGTRTITQCPSCEKDIQGLYHGHITLEPFQPQPFCKYCGQPFPWTEARLAAGHAIAAELDELTPVERRQLSRSIDEIIRDTPETAAAALRIKKLIKKVGKAGGETLRKVIVQIATEAAKRELGLG